MTGAALKIVCAGYLVRYPAGGHTWHHLQYLVGLSRLGHDVVFVEEAGWEDACVDPRGGASTSDPRAGLAYMSDVFRRHGLEGRWAYVDLDGTTYGVDRSVVRGWCRQADLLVDLSGVTWLPEFDNVRRRALVDTDPVFTQLAAFGLPGAPERYDVRFTYGENIPAGRSSVPPDGHRWLPTRQPVVAELWPVLPSPPEAPWTTVMSWSNFGPKVVDGVVYGHKDVQFPPYLDLPRVTRTPMEIATVAPPTVARQLADGGWSLVRPQEVSATPGAYQRYLAASKGEFAVAKQAYVSTRCGWFSDRSAGYLASGRPVVLQDTGFSDVLPTGEGLLSYSTPDEAREALAAVEADPARHRKAARHLAETALSSDVVLSALLEQAL